MKSEDIHEQLMDHLSHLTMMYPPREALLKILKENFSPIEAQIALLLPSKVLPLHGITVGEISTKIKMSREILNKTLESLADMGLIFSYKNDDGEMCYALIQIGYGFPQTFFWKGEDTHYSRKMAKNILKYFDKEVTKEIYSTDPMCFRYLPVDETVESDVSAVLPYQVMENIIKKAKLIAVSNCSCRATLKLVDRGCDHPMEVCIKFNDLARFLMDKGFAREISVEEALQISKEASEAGLVHFTENCISDIQQFCNCCGHCCWNLGRIRRRHIPKDEIIATYFIRETIEEDCTGCGACINICPTNVIEIVDDKAVVDKEWCLGCGVCISKCPSDAIKIVIREDLKGKTPEENLKILHEKILKTRK